MENHEESPKVTVVVPVYKVEKYLRACVESVLAQTFTDFELILVDDGSPDKSGEICDELAKLDSRIRVFHRANEGSTSARKFGVEKAKGEWINFVDSDDLLPKDALKSLIAEASDDTDWVQGGELLRFNDGETPREETRTGKVTNFDLVGFAERMLSVHLGPTGKLVRRKLFTSNVFEIPKEIKVHEDILMNFRLLANKPRNPKEIDKTVYYYRKGLANSTASSHIATEKYIFRYAKLMLAEARKISTPNTKKRLLAALSRSLCIDAALLVAYGIPIKFPHRLATLIRRGARSRPRDFFVYLCLSSNSPSIARAGTKIFCFLRRRKFDAKNKTLLE